MVDVTNVCIGFSGWLEQLAIFYLAVRETYIMIKFTIINIL